METGYTHAVAGSSKDPPSSGMKRGAESVAPANLRPSSRPPSQPQPSERRLSALETLEAGRRSGPPVDAAASHAGVARARALDARPSRASTDRRFWRTARRGAMVFAVVLAAIGLVSFGTALYAVRRVESELPSISDLKSTYHPSQVTRVLARDGTLLAELFTKRRTVVPIASLPPHVKLAVLAAEDAGFYEHEGLNYFGILRAFFVNLKSGRTRQGGSTITQQVVKNILLDSERTYKRKIREALLSRRLEQELTKDEILELYLNHIYFGHGRWGIEEAARDNFGKSAKDLTIAEGALLAGLVAGPEVYSPRRDAQKAIGRRTFVLEQMHTKGFLNDAQLDAALKEPVHLATVVEVRSELAPEAVEMARKLLAEVEPERSKWGGFVITTTIDPRLQDAARKAVRDNIAAYDKRHGLLGPWKAPKAAATHAKGDAPDKDKVAAHAPKAPAIAAKDAVFEGTPVFEQHRILNGVVVGQDDALGTLDVRLGTIIGNVRLSDFERYNPNHLPPSDFAALGAVVRVSMLAPIPNVAVVAGSSSPSSAPSPDAGAAAETAPVVPMKIPLRLEQGPESAFVAIDVRTRTILALVGNYEGAAFSLDRATQARRQPGSTFKPIVYSYAIHSRRFTPASLVDVNPEAFDGGYKPTNYEGWTGKDPLRLREALANSVNVVAVRVLRDVGPANVVAWGQSLGIASTLKPDLSLALGSYEVRPLELCGAYATFAAGGVYDEPRLVNRIVGPDGKEVPLKPVSPPRRVLDEAEAYIITSMLTSVVDHGTAVRAKSLARPVAGKTGTSNSAKDTWFSGYSTEIAATTWVGYDDGKSLGNETGGSAALPAWIQFMKVAHEQKPPSEFPRPPGIVSVVIDARSGKLPYEGDTDTLDEVFLAGTEPTEVAEPEVKPEGADGTGLGPSDGSPSPEVP